MGVTIYNTLALGLLKDSLISEIDSKRVKGLQGWPTMVNGYNGGFFFAIAQLPSLADIAV